MAASGSSKSSLIESQRGTAGNKERRLEDILADEDDSDVEFPFDVEGGKRGKGSRRLQHSPPRQPRSTLYEEVGEDDFIYARESRKQSSSSTGGSSKARVPGAKGPPPSSNSHTTVRERIAEAETPIIRRNKEKRAKIDSQPSTAGGSNVQGRKSSGSVKASRRTSLLKNGKPAHPHPRVPDGELYRHCSGDLGPQERMGFLASWTLERSRKELEVSSKCREPLMAALRTTLLDLSEGSLHIDWQDSAKGKGKAKVNNGSSVSSKDGTKGTRLPSHPRNDANAKAEKQVSKTVEDMQTEARAWKEAEAELEAFETATKQLRDEPEDDEVELDVTAMEKEDREWNAEDVTCMKKARLAMQLERHWATGSTQGEKLIRKASEYVSDQGEDDASVLGTELDPRWKDVEFKADVLRSKAHSFAQLSTLSERYIDAISARGARAIHEMTQASGLSSEGSSSNTTLNESQNNLERILSSIRTIEGVAENEGRGIGDTSEGDILRALAGFN